jgi:hypothetical protein
MKKSKNHWNSLIALTVSYWGLLVGIGIGFVILDQTASGLITLVCSIIVVALPLSYYLFKGNFSDWYD